MGEFLQFVGTLRSNNLGIPILVGGDFNMDMKSYDMERYKDLSIVPYRYSTVQYSTVQGPLHRALQAAQREERHEGPQEHLPLHHGCFAGDVQSAKQLQ